MRRIPYNLVVGLIGVPSLMFTIFAIERWVALGPGQDAVEPLAVIGGVFLANLMYTCGWTLELLLRAVNIRGDKVGPALLASGIIFSLLVVLAPAAYWASRWISLSISQ